MRSSHTLLVAGLLSLSLGAGVAVEQAIANQPAANQLAAGQPSVELAQATPPPPGQPPGAPPARARPDPGRFIEGRLAFLKTELHITDQQLPLWETVAKQMRDQAKQRADLFRQMQASRDQTLTVPERMERRLSMSRQGIEQQQAMLSAIKPLYDSMSDEQKANADMLLAPGRMGHHHPFRRG